jgi:hypothetical protein
MPVLVCDFFWSAMGRIELINKLSAFALWFGSRLANKKHAGPHGGLVRQPIVLPMGQFELLASALQRMKWAHACGCT